MSAKLTNTTPAPLMCKARDLAFGDYCIVKGWCSALSTEKVLVRAYTATHQEVLLVNIADARETYNGAGDSQVQPIQAGTELILVVE